MDVVHPSSDMRSSLDVPQRPLSPSMTPVQAVAPQPVASLSTESKPVASTNNWAGLPNYQPPAAAPESPFLPDTKVEKRPLGAFSNETPAIEEELLLPEKPEPATTNELDSVPDKPSIPAELDKAVLGVEPGSSTHKNDAEMSSNPLSYSSANGSISQQYAEKPVIDKPVTSSIYDNGVYNAATSKPAKKKSSWLIVIWIIILLIVGVGAGLAFYYFMPNFKLPF
jgi:hypothetical protein